MESIGALLRARRLDAGLSQAQLARRAGTTQAALSRLERDEISPTFASVERLLTSLGERLDLTTSRFELPCDPAHLADLRRRTPSERLELAMSCNKLAGGESSSGAAALTETD